MAGRLPIAQSLEEVVPGVWTWSVANPQIGGFVATSHAFASDRGVVLVDPFRLADEASAALGPVEAIVLSSGSHQRAAWELRAELGVPLHLPRQVRELAEEPDARYGDGDELPGGLRAFFTPGAGTSQHALLARGVLVTADLFTSTADAGLRLVSARYMHDPEQARESARRLLELEFAVLATGHGSPVTDDPKGAIRAALEA